MRVIRDQGRQQKLQDNAQLYRRRQSQITEKLALNEKRTKEEMI